MRGFLALVFWASTAALVAAAFTGEDRTVSLRIWLVAFVTWFAGALLYRLVDSARLVPSRFRLPAATSANHADGTTRALKDFRSLESLILRSRENERTHRQQLRPRLRAIADHYLLVHHGVHRAEQPERAAAVLGDVAWLLEDDTTLPAPKFEDIERFLDRVLPATKLASANTANITGTTANTTGTTANAEKANS